MATDHMKNIQDHCKQRDQLRRSSIYHLSNCKSCKKKTSVDDGWKHGQSHIQLIQYNLVKLYEKKFGSVYQKPHKGPSSLIK